MAVFNDGIRLASGGSDSLIIIWDTSNGALLKKIEGEDWVLKLLVLNDDKLN